MGLFLILKCTSWDGSSYNIELKYVNLSYSITAIKMLSWFTFKVFTAKTVQWPD